MLASAEEKNRETYLSGLSYKSWLLPVTWTRASALLFTTFQKQPSNVIFLKHEVIYISLSLLSGFPGSSDGKESAYNEGDPGLIPGFGRLVTYFIYSSVYMPVPISQFIPPCLFLCLSLYCFLHLWLYFCFVNKFICTVFFLDSTYKWYHIFFLSLSDFT